MKKSRDTEIADLIQAIRLLVRRSRRAGAAQGLSWTEAAVLSRLSKDGPATTAELARAESMKPQSMGAKIVVLEEQKLVERKRHPSDGRQVVIVLTPQGSAVCKMVQDAQRAWFADIVEKLDDSEQSTLFTATKIIQRMGEL
ncbi:MAG: MarR family transcriptional regulator [Candidatus Obscuribacterales bacterium]|nr:MarR family transcriptional regulator [Candidatus Obscuribacterales bacterium]